MTAASEDRELVFTRVFEAPREMVYQAWTDPKHVAKWWGPKGSTNSIQSMDVRPGGALRITTHGPDGVENPNEIVYEEVVKPERLVYLHGDEREPGYVRVTVTFTEDGGKTTVTIEMLFKTAAKREEIVVKRGAFEVVNQSMDRLAERLAAMKAAAPPAHELTMTRIFDAPRETVFAAWTDAERLKRWWGPKGFTNPVCEFDARPGGAIRIHMRAPNGVIYPMTGVVLEIAPPERLVFVSAALDEKGDALFEILNTVTFAALGGKTQVTLHATVTMETAEAPRYLAGMEMGWSLSLDRLGAGGEKGPR